MNESEDDQRAEWESRRREYRERTERLLRPVCAALEIDEDISSLGLRPVREYADMFPEIEIFAITGCGFERPSLPSSSYMYFAFNRVNDGAPFVELTPRTSALNTLLAAHWDVLPNLSPVQLADFILTMNTVGTVYHEVLADMTEIDKQSRRDEGFVLNDDARRLMIDSPFTTTSLDATSNGISIHALTLFGWMHEKQNLGVTDITIARGGDLQIGDRQTMCDPVFRDMPDIWY